MVRMLCFGMVVLFATHTAAAQSLTRAELPDVRKGDVAVYQLSNPRNGEKRPPATVVVEEVTADRIVLKMGNGAIRNHTREWNQQDTIINGQTDVKIEPYWPHFQFPLEVGKKWSLPVVVTSQGGNQINRHQWQAEVVGVEKITVAAGTFEVFKLQVNSPFSGQQTGKMAYSGRRQITYWYAPSIGRVVRSELEDRGPGYQTQEHVELLSFQRADAAK